MRQTNIKCYREGKRNERERVKEKERVGLVEIGKVSIQRGNFAFAIALIKLKLFSASNWEC